MREAVLRPEMPDPGRRYRISFMLAPNACPVRYPG